MLTDNFNPIACEGRFLSSPVPRIFPSAKNFVEERLLERIPKCRSEHTVDERSKLMSTEQETGPSEEMLKTAYAELCRCYQGIDDFRAKCLGFLPLVSGTGIFLLFSDTFLKNVNPSSKYLPVIGLFGFFITLGLLFYEMRGFQRCIRLIHVGKELEKLMHVEGLFLRRPHSVGRFINEPIAAGIIYSTVLAAWVYVAVIASWPSGAVWIASASYLMSFLSVWCFYLTQREPKEALPDIWKKNWHRWNVWLHGRSSERDQRERLHTAEDTQPQ